MIREKIGSLKGWISEHTYCYAMLYLVFYVVVFLILDFTMEPRYILHSAWDDRIPFCEYFIVFYFAWYPAFFLSLVWYMLRDKEEFQQLWFIMFTGMTFCLLCYVLFPNGLNLREEAENRNVFCVLVNLVRGVDAAVNVCPSIHVSSSVAVALVTARSKLFQGHRGRQAALILLMILISISTMFVKQHSVIDVACGAAVSLILYVIAYHTNWRRLLRGRLEMLL
ncbi:MAG: phosphatase PAP2 family protein [Lachnospiraceae bacterium]|nr:phosphatase PAP2 family protein [Lachnospiraceae bacterium]